MVLVPRSAHLLGQAVPEYTVALDQELNLRYTSFIFIYNFDILFIMDIFALILTFLNIFLMWTILKIFIVFVTILFQNQYCFFGVFFCLAMQHMGSQLPNQGLNPHSLHWKAES